MNSIFADVAATGIGKQACCVASNAGAGRSRLPRREDNAKIGGPWRLACETAYSYTVVYKKVKPWVKRRE